MRADGAENIYGATVAAATTSGIDAVRIVAGDDAFTFVVGSRRSTASETAALARGTLRVFRAGQSSLEDLSVGGGDFRGLPFDIAAPYNE